MNLDLVEILKNCPKGTKLYSKCFGIVEFLKIQKDWILVADYIGSILKYDKNGKFYYAEESAEIDLFPSKEQRDWNKWHSPFVKGDILVSENGNIVLCSHIDEEQVVYYHCILNCWDKLEIHNSAGVGYSYNCNLANDSQKQKLFDALKKEGYEWDEEKKELKKIEEKFDVSTLQPFDKVLVQDWQNKTWTAALFSHCHKKHDIYYWDTFVTTAQQSFPRCVPYNYETKHLLGTKDDAPEKYINW